MKKLITFSAICALAGILLTSCNSNWSITKRHFNNGYYVDKGKNKQAVIAQKEKNELSSAQTCEKINTRSEKQTLPEKTNSEETENTVAGKHNEQIMGKNITGKEKTQNLKLQIKTFEGPIAQIKETFSKISQTKSTKEDGEGLSLFWIVILVILILWALGVISAGFAIGSIINLLLLAALILLILWLLRII